MRMFLKLFLKFGWWIIWVIILLTHSYLFYTLVCLTLFLKIIGFAIRPELRSLLLHLLAVTVVKTFDLSEPWLPICRTVVITASYDCPGSKVK